MRNLQKILALVLALVMSLSLMATAGADFTDQADIDANYAESVEVLNGLGVFKGYPTGDFQPKGEITRAEVAAIIYRIATHDVDDAQKDIYSEYQKFSDVSGHWAAGYINYCANAEYIKGRGDGKFYPDDKVTGYEALAMILRVVGYDKNGEFTGTDWHIQTAAIANQQKVTAKVSSGLLAEKASREMVAELLCKAILIPTVNYTLAYGYQQSNETIAKKSFGMECLEGVVTGNEVADLKGSSSMADGQTRLLIGEEEKTMNFSTGLDSIGKSVRAYIRPQGGTTVMQLVPGKVYDTEKNHVYDSFASVGTVGNSTGSEQGINSIAGAEHFVNYDYTNRWTANIRITYRMLLHWTEYEAKTMVRDNEGTLWTYSDTATDHKGATSWTANNCGSADNWATQFTTDADYTYVYEKVIPLDKILTDQDFNNLYNIFQNATTNNKNWVRGVVYVGTTVDEKDISDQIRWTDFINAYLKDETNRTQVESNGRGNRLIIIDNDDDGIAEYVLQTKYTIAKVSSDVKNVDVINTKLYDNNANNDAVNSTTASNSLVPVSGNDLAKSEDALVAGDVVIYALIDGNIRAQKAETKTEKVNTITRGTSITTVGGDTYYQSAVHTHSEKTGLKSGVNNMAGNTTYTMFFDLDGNLAAYTEGVNGGLVLITNGWYRSTIGGAEYAIQAYAPGEDGAYSLQTVNVSTSGAQFVGRANGDNQWNNLRSDFGLPGNGGGNGPINSEGTAVKTIVANLDGDILTPVDQAYLYSQNLRILDMVGNEVPGQNNVSTSWGRAYRTVGQPYNGTFANSYPAYNTLDNGDTPGTRPANTVDKKYENSYEVRSLASTVYYVVYNAHGTNTMTDGRNVVVRQYSSAPDLSKANVEDVYAVGAKSKTATGVTYYTAQMVVIEVSGGYSRTSEQVFIPNFDEISVNAKIENVTMIRDGEIVTLPVDMYNSRTYDWYYTAGSTTANDNPNNHTRLRGLYYLDPSDTDPGVYVIERMTPDQIRDSGKYHIGYINESAFGNTGVLGNRYAQIEIMTRPAGYSTGNALNTWYGNDDVFGTDPTLAYATTPVAPASTNLNDRYKTANVTDNSKFYTYNGSALTASNDYAVLAQYLGDDAGTNVYGLNERIIWAEDAAGNPVLGADGKPTYRFNQTISQNYGNRNEVLVCYNGSNIVYAISFNDTTDSINNAQKVWWNILPQDAVSTPTVSTSPASVELVAPVAAGARVADPTKWTHIADLTAGSPANQITWNKWNPYTGDKLYLEIKPADGNVCSVNGTILPIDEFGVAHYQLRKNVTSNDTEYVTITSQKGSAGPVNTTYAIQYLPEKAGPSGIYSTNPARVEVGTPTDGVNGADGTVVISIANADTLYYEDFKDMIRKTESSDTLEVVAYNGANVLGEKEGMNHATKVVITLTDRDGVKKTWVAEDTNLKSSVTNTYYTITAGEGVTIVDNSTGRPVSSAASGTVLKLQADCDANGGTFVVTAAPTTAPSVATVSNGVATSTWTVESANVTITFVPTTSNTYGITVNGTGIAVKTPDPARVNKNAALPNVTLKLTDNTVTDKIIIVGDITVGGEKRTYTVSYSGTDAIIDFDGGYTMKGDMVINAELKDVDQYVSETVKPKDEPRTEYDTAYKRSGISIKPDATNPNQINITLSKKSFTTYVKDAGSAADVTILGSTTVGATELYAGVAFEAPAIAKSVKYALNGDLNGGNAKLAPKDGGTNVDGTDKFKGDTVRFYFQVAEITGTAGSVTAVEFTENRTVPVKLQFYSDLAGTEKIGGELTYYVDVSFAE